VQVQPFTVALENKGQIKANAALDADGAKFQFEGTAEHAPLQNTLAMLGIRLPVTDLAGPEKINVTLQNLWRGFGKPYFSGTVLLTRNTWKIPGTTTTLQIENAQIKMAAKTLSIDDLDVRIKGAGTVIHGKLSIPYPCEGAVCSADFDLHANTLDLSEAGAWLGATPVSSGLLQQTQQLFTGGQIPDWISKKAHGKVTVDLLTCKGLTVRKFSAGAEFTDRQLRMLNLKGNVVLDPKVGSWVEKYDGSLPQPMKKIEFVNTKGEIVALADMFKSSTIQTKGK